MRTNVRFQFSLGWFILFILLIIRISGQYCLEIGANENENENDKIPK